MSSEYSKYHKKRFHYLLKKTRDLTLSKDAKILEVGRGPFTRLLAEEFANVDTLGYPIADSEIANLEALSDSYATTHIEFDLIHSLDPKHWAELGAKYDVIIFAEVLEHLFINADMVFCFLRSGLKPEGFLLCQTPNGVNINNRLKMLMGINPIVPFGINLKEPGHYREFTKAELLKIAQNSGLRPVSHEFQNYFGHFNPVTRVLDGIGFFIPPLRRGQTVVFRNTELPSQEQRILADQPQQHQN